MSIDINTIINTLTIPKVNKGDIKLQMPTVPIGFSIEFIGANLQQVIDKNMNIYEPLIDTKVLVAFRIKQNNIFTDTNDMEISIPGKYSNTVGSNEKPNVLPDLREWVGGTGTFIPTNTTRIVIDVDYENELINIAKNFKIDYEFITGVNLSVIVGQPALGDFYFTLYSDDKSIGKEGYYIYIDDYIRIEAISKNGVFYGTKTILQIIKQKNNIISRGIIRDYPKYEIRGFMIDVAKKFFGIEYLKEILKVMSWYKLNDFHMHINDNFLDINEENWSNIYSAFRLQSEIYPEITAKDGYYSKEELNTLINLGKEYGINVVIEINLTSGILSFIKYKAQLALGIGPLRNYLDTSNPESYGFMDMLLKEYLSGENPILAYNDFHIGGKDYANSQEYIESFREYINYYLKQIRDEYGITPRLWGSLNKYSGIASVTKEKVIMNIYNLQQGDAKKMIESGYKIINTLDELLFITPTSNEYNNYLNVENLYKYWSVNDFKNYKVLESTPQLKGATFALWNNEISKGLSELDIYNRLVPAMQIITEKNWMGKVSRTFEDFNNVCKNVSDVPNIKFLNGVLGALDITLQRYYISKGYLVNGAKIDNNNFVNFIGGINKGYAETLVNVDEFGEYNLNIKYLSSNMDRDLMIDINGVSTGEIYKAIETNGFDSNQLNLKVILNSGNNKIKFYGEDLEYAPSIESFTLELIATDIFTFLDSSNKEVASIEFNINNKNLSININEQGTPLTWGNLLEFYKVEKDNIIPKYKFNTAILSNGAKIDASTGLLNSIGGTTDGTATITVTANESGKYNMALSYKNIDTENKLLAIDVNSINTGTVYSMPSSNDGSLNIVITLNVGSNIIKFHGNGTNYAAQLKYFTLTKKQMSSYIEAKNLLLGAEEFNIVFVGDSITHGAAHTKGYRSFAEHFNERIRGESIGKYLKKKNFVVNTGVSSAVSTDILNYFDRRIAIYNPKIVIILIGMNDCANNQVPLNQYKINVKTLIDKIRGIGAIPVLQTCNTINPVGTRGSLPQYMEAIREISTLEEVPIIDHYKYWTEQQGIDSTTQSKWLSDAIHPNESGHLVMAKKIFEYFNLLDSNSYTSNMNYPINISRDLGRYVDTIVYPKYNDIINVTPLVSYKINRQFMGNEYIEKNEDLNKIKTLIKGTVVARFNLTTSEMAKTIFSVSDSKVDASNTTLAINGGAIHFSVRNNGVLTTNITTSKTGYNDGNWHTVVVNVDNIGTKIYIDGANIHTDVTKGFFNLVTSADTVSIGRNLDFKTTGEWYYKGAIAYIDIYNSNLTEEQCISRSNENMLSNLNDISNVIASNEAGPWIFTGDNVTAGKSTTYGHRNYVEHVEERIRWEMNNSIMTRREKFMINMASKDTTSIEILNNFNNLIGRFNPKVVFLMIGANENIPVVDFKSNLTSIILKIKLLNAVVILQTPIFNGKVIDEYVTVIKDIANSQKIALINHYDFWVSLQQTQPQLVSSWLDSNLEPNHRGQLEISKKILRDLNIFSSSSVTCSFTISTPGDNLEVCKNELGVKIQEAYSLYNGSIEGTSAGQFPLGAKKDLLNTIKQCEKLQINTTVGIISLTQGRRNLHLAMNEFIEKKIK